MTTKEIKQIKKQMAEQQLRIEHQQIRIKYLEDTLDFVIANKPWYKLLI